MNPSSVNLESYKRQTRRTIIRFLDGRLSFPDCIVELEEALSQFLPNATAAEFSEMRALALANNEEVMREMERRGSPPATSVTHN